MESGDFECTLHYCADMCTSQVKMITTWSDIFHWVLCLSRMANMGICIKSADNIFLWSKWNKKSWECNAGLQWSIASPCFSIHPCINMSCLDWCNFYTSWLKMWFTFLQRAQDTYVILVSMPVVFLFSFIPLQSAQTLQNCHLYIVLFFYSSKIEKIWSEFILFKVCVFGKFACMLCLSVHKF
jgi:hypothetical protein